MKQVLLLSMVIATALSQSGEGVYAVMDSGNLGLYGRSLSQFLSQTLNNLQGVPDVNGESDDVTYTFSSFGFNVMMDGLKPTVTSNDLLDLTWSTLQFTISFDYHICAKHIPFHPCEKGTITSVTNNAVSLDVGVQLDSSGSLYHAWAPYVHLNFNQGDITVNVHCTSTVCVIPVGKIADAVAGNFTNNFQYLVSQVVNKAAAQTINQYPTALVLGESGLEIFTKANLWTTSSGSIVVGLDGGFTSTSNPTPSPYSPQFTPPQDAFVNPPSGFSIYAIPYSFSTGFWAANNNGVFTQVVTQDSLPAGLPFKLNTNDNLFLGVNPGLASYPNMDIVVKTSLYNETTVSIGTQGLAALLNLKLDFQITNSSLTLDAWSLVLDVQAQGALTVTVGTPQEVTIAPTLPHIITSASLLSANIGNPDATKFAKIVQLALAFASPKIPPQTINLPAALGFYNPSVSYMEGYIVLNGQLYWDPVFETNFDEDAVINKIQKAKEICTTRLL